METNSELEELKKALVHAISKNSAKKAREIVEGVFRSHIEKLEKILPCPICGKQMDKSPRQPLSVPLVKCQECKYVAMQYKGVCRTTRNRVFNSGYSREITIRSFDLDSTERAIVLHLSDHSGKSLELKSKDEFYLLVAKPGLSEEKNLSLLINTTIGKTINLYGADGRYVFPQFETKR